MNIFPEEGRDFLGEILDFTREIRDFTRETHDLIKFLAIRD